MSCSKKSLIAASLFTLVFGISLHAQTAPTKKYSWDTAPETPPAPAPAQPQIQPVTPPAPPAAQNPAPASQPRYTGFEPVAETSKKKKAHLEISIAAAYIMDLGSDADNQTGWGASAALLVLPPKDADTDWQLRYGLEFLYFGTSGDDGRMHETIDAGILFLNIGGTYALSKYFEIGAIIGTGTGGTYGETTGDGDKEQNGNWNWACQIKPMAIVHITENLQIYAAYRIAYIAPFVNTDLIGYKSVDMIQQSAEVGVIWRF